MSTAASIVERTGTENVSVVERLPHKQIDESRCMTLDVISTGTPDRMGDVLVSRGCLTNEHRTYPVILWNHGRSHDVLGTLPIGLAIDKSGNYGVIVDDDAVLAWSKYSQSNPLAVQLFALQAEGVLRGNSIGARPVKATELPRRTMPDKSLARCFQYDQWVLHEYSKTPGPVNAEALTIRVEKGRVNDEPIHPILKSYLEPMMVQGKEWANGWNFSKASEDDSPQTPVQKSHEDSKPNPTAPLKRPESDMNDDKDDDDEKKKKDRPVEKAAVVEDKTKEVVKSLKPTARAMASIMQAARDLRVAIAKSAEDVEDEMALAAILEIDGYLEKSEQTCAETLMAKGILEAPEPLTNEILKSSLTESKDISVVVKGYGEFPRLFSTQKTMDKGTEENLDPVEVAKLNRKLAAMEARLVNRK